MIPKACPARSIGIALASSLASGCGSLLGTSFAPPPELAHDAHRYALVVDYQSYSTEKLKRHVEFKSVEKPESGQPGPCRFAFQLAGELEERSAGPATRDDEYSMSRHSTRFDLRIEAPPALSVKLSGTLERAVVRATEEPEKTRAPVLGEITVEEGPVHFRGGHGQLSSGGQPVGELKLEGSALHVQWQGVAYVVEPQGSASRAVWREGTMVSYAQLDAGHWGVGERGFQVAADPSLDCEKLQRTVSVLLMAQSFMDD